MLVLKHLEPTVNGAVILVTGTDSAGNDLVADVEFLIKMEHTSIQAVEALANLLEMVDDMRIIGGDRRLSNGAWKLPEEIDENEQSVSESPRGYVSNNHNPLR